MKFWAQITYNKDIYNLTGDSTPNNPKWTCDLKLVTQSPYDTFKVKLFESHSDSFTPFQDIDVPIYKFNFERNDQSAVCSIDLRIPGTMIMGSISFEVNYISMEDATCSYLPELYKPEEVGVDPTYAFKRKFFSPESIKAYDIPDVSKYFVGKLF